MKGFRVRDPRQPALPLPAAPALSETLGIWDLSTSFTVPHAAGADGGLLCIPRCVGGFGISLATYSVPPAPHDEVTQGPGEQLQPEAITSGHLGPSFCNSSVCEGSLKATSHPRRRGPPSALLFSRRLPRIPEGSPAPAVPPNTGPSASFLPLASYSNWNRLA